MSAQPASSRPEDNENQTAMFGVRVIAERVVLRIQGETGWRLVELSLDQARQARMHIDEAISTVEAGASVAPSLGDLVNSLPE
jgi:hypothetical protein